MGSNNPLITIGIPTYNRADGYLPGVLECATSQTYQNIEIIVSDNCSSDSTEDVINNIDDSRLIYIRHNKNIGPNNNFNFCLEKANGLYFLLLHDDDLIDKDFIEACVNKIVNNKNVGIIRTGTRIIDGSGVVKNEIKNLVDGYSYEEFIMAWYYRKTALYLCSTLFNTKQLKEIGGFHSSKNLFQDVIAEVRLAAAHGREDISEVKASFRRHGDEITFSSKVEDWCEDSLELLDVICDLAQVNKDLIRQESLTYFTRKNFGRASAIRSPLARWQACLSVSRYFNRFPPPFWALFPRGPLSHYLRERERNRDEMLCEERSGL